MKLVFTEYVRALVARASPADEPPPAVWDKLRGALVSELRKRSLWNVPPSYLGVYGYTSWSEDEALEELLVDCFTFVFVERLPSLAAQLKIKDNIEGLPFRSLRNFLYDTQKRHDPLGFRVFMVVQVAIRQLLEVGRMRVLAGNPKVGSDTVLGFVPGDRGRERGADLGGLAVAWADELLPELMTARGKKIEEVARRLGRRITGFASRGVEALRLKELVDPLKHAVRGRWNAVWGHSEGETAFDDTDDDLIMLVRRVWPETHLEDRDAFQKLHACMADALDRRVSRTRDHLHRLWVFLHTGAASAEDLPSRRRLAGLLDIPRDRLPALHHALGEMVEECRASFSRGSGGAS